MLGVAALVLLAPTTALAAFVLGAAGASHVAADTLLPPTSLTVGQSCLPGPVPSLRGTGAESRLTSGSTISVSRPAGALAGDLLVTAITWVGNVSITPPSSGDWSLAVTESGLNVTQAVYWRWATGSDPTSWSWTGASAHAVGIMTAWVGVDPSAPIGGTSSLASTSNKDIVAPAVTTVRANSRVLGVFGQAAGSSTTPPAALTELWDFATTGSGASTTLASTEGSTLSASAPGTYGPYTAVSDSAGRNIGQLVVLRARLQPHEALTWTRSASGWATGQELTRSGVGTSSLGPDVTSWTDGPLAPGTTRSYSLVARVGSWTSSAATGSRTFSCY